MHFAIYKSGERKYFFTLIDDKFNVLCTSSPTEDKESVFHAIETIRMEGQDASLLDFS